MDSALTRPPIDRRQAGRLRLVDHHGIVATRVRPGIAALLVDISAGGALLETEDRLLPGARVEVQLQTASRSANVRGRVLRSAVVRLGAHSILYRSAIGFERQLWWLTDEGASGNSVPNHEKRSGLAIRADATPRIL